MRAMDRKSSAGMLKAVHLAVDWRHNESAPRGRSADLHHAGDAPALAAYATRLYTRRMERKMCWCTFTVRGLGADFVRPLWWALGATIPIFILSWWVAYRSDWF